MTHKEIERYRKQLTEIIERPKEPDGNPAKGTKKELRELAKRVGANTRAIFTGPEGKQFGYDAGISDLIDNIHTALQTAVTIDMCKTATNTYKGAVAASVIALLGVTIGFFVAKEANDIALDTLQKSYTPWLMVTSVKPMLIDPNKFKISIGCKNFSEAPALKLDIKYDILGETVSKRVKLYDSDVLMPNDSRELEINGTVKNGRAGQIVDKLNNGELSLGFDINYEDVFGHKIEIHQVRRWIRGTFRNTSYEVIKGLE